MEGHEKQNKDVSVWCLISMASIPLVMTLGNSMLIPVLPIFEEKVGISSFQSSMVITSYSVASIFLIPIAGYLSDRFGRKMVILPSLDPSPYWWLGCRLCIMENGKSLYMDHHWEGIARDWGVWCLAHHFASGGGFIQG